MLSKTGIELRPADGVIRCGRRFSRLEIDIAEAAGFGEGGGGEDVVDAPAPVVVEGVAEIIPVGVLDTIGMELAEDVGEAPPQRFLVSVAGVDVEVDVVDTAVGMVDVDGLGGD